LHSHASQAVSLEDARGRLYLAKAFVPDWRGKQKDGSPRRLVGSQAIREKVLHPDHPATARTLNHLANLLRDQGELASARLLLERALGLQEKVLGPSHPNVAVPLNNLAYVLRDQGEVDASRLLTERSLVIQEAAWS
jgi:tetratricopeptide (TPR) repeat protein